MTSESYISQNSDEEIILADDDEAGFDGEHGAACPAEEVRWEEWEEVVEMDRRTRQPSQAARAASTIQLTDPHCPIEPPGKHHSRASKLDRGISKDAKDHMQRHLEPIMPCI